MAPPLDSVSQLMKSVSEKEWNCPEASDGGLFLYVHLPSSESEEGHGGLLVVKVGNRLLCFLAHSVKDLDKVKERAILL